MWLSAQSHGFRINTTFLLNNRPLSGVGYEFSSDSSLFTVGAGLEFGSFDEQSASHSNSSVLVRSLTGVGFQPEVRRYFGIGGHKSPLGFFTQSYLRLRQLWLIEQSGIKTTATGYQFESPQTLTTRGLSLDYGLGVGFKTGRRSEGAHVEAVISYCTSYSRLNESPTHLLSFLRFDVFVVGIFRKDQSRSDDWDW